MQSFQYTVTDPVGIHARPAGLLVKCAQSCGSNIHVSFGAKTADAKRLFSVMGLGVHQNDVISFTVEGDSEAEDMQKLKSFCSETL